jgi:hypothetical protein
MKMQKLKTTVIGLVLLTVASTYAANVNIGSFATGSFTLDAGSSIVPTQSASGLTTNLTVVGGDIWYGAFSSSIDWSRNGWTSLGTDMGYTASNLGLYMSVASQASPTPFTVTFFDSANLAIQSFTATTAVSASPTFVALAPTAVNGFLGGSLASVQSFAFSWDGGGAINTTLGSVQADIVAIPEPSVASLLALGTVGLVALRVRRKS